MKPLPRKLDSITEAPIGLWLLLRLSSIVVASLALISSLHAIPSVRGLLLGPWYSYDAEYYVRIVSNGYRAGDSTSGFHPLYPWLARGLFFVIHDPLLSLLIVSSVAGALLTITFYKLARFDADRNEAWIATALFLCWPVTIAIFGPYTEATHLVLATLCFINLRLKRFWVAGLFGGLVALTRQHGIFLSIPIAWEIWEAQNRDWRQALKSLHQFLPVLLVPAGYALWILYRAFAINDVSPDFSSPQRFIFSVMVSPTAYQVYKEQQFMLPWMAVWKAMKALAGGHLHWSAYGDVFLAALFIAAFIFSWRYLRLSYRLYVLAILLVALSYHTGAQINPYISLPRHMLPACLIFIGVALRYKFQRPKFIILMLAICQALYLCCFVWESWVL